MPLTKAQAKARRDRVRRWALTGWLLMFTLATIVALQQNRQQTTDARQLAEQNRQLVREGRQAHDALCALRDDLQKRIENSRQFLDEHPDGIPGIPAAVISKSIRDQSRTVDALNTALACK